jgi:hypothetical protein
MLKLNEQFNNPRLIKYPGYPLESLENLLQKISVNQLKHFGYAVFVRTASAINPFELNEYISLLSKLTKRIIFLEVVELKLSHQRSIVLEDIPVEESISSYGVMKIHNYPKLLMKNGFKVIDSKQFDGKGDGFNMDYGETHFWYYCVAEKT